MREDLLLKMSLAELYDAVQYGNASGETPTDIFPDGIRVLIRELVSEMAEERVSRVKVYPHDRDYRQS